MMVTPIGIAPPSFGVGAGAPAFAVQTLTFTIVPEAATLFRLVTSGASVAPGLRRR